MINLENMFYDLFIYRQFILDQFFMLQSTGKTI